MFHFKVWDQSNDGQTMAVRAANVDVLAALAAVCNQPDMTGNWDSLQDYLNAAATAAASPAPYVRPVDVLWGRAGLGVPQWSMCHDRRFRVTYSGNVRAGGGFAVQGYSIVDPAWNAQLQPHHQHDIQVRYIPGPHRDLIVVLP